MSQANVAVARRWFEEVWNQRRTETIDELLLQSYEASLPGEPGMKARSSENAP